MTTVSIDLPKDEADRLAEMAAREGETPEAIALAAVRARLQDDDAWRAEIEAGAAELDAGLGMTLEDFEREMDAFMTKLRQTRG